MGNTVMFSTPGSTSSNQLSRDEEVFFNCFSVSVPTVHLLLVVLKGWTLYVPYFIISQDTPLSVAAVSPEVQFQLSYALPLETTITSSIQGRYDAPWGMIQDADFPPKDAPYSSTVQPRSTGTSSDNSVRNCILRSPSTPPY